MPRLAARALDRQIRALQTLFAARTKRGLVRAGKRRHAGELFGREKQAMAGARHFVLVSQRADAEDEVRAVDTDIASAPGQEDPGIGASGTRLNQHHVRLKRRARRLVEDRSAGKKADAARAFNHWAEAPKANFVRKPQMRHTLNFLFRVEDYHGLNDGPGATGLLTRQYTSHQMDRICNHRGSPPVTESGLRRRAKR